MKKIKIGVVGGYRGNSMIQYCKLANNAEVVAICDNNPTVLATQKALCAEKAEKNITFYDDFQTFLTHDMDAVVLANFANEHAPFAIAAMKAGKHVYSEVLPVQTLKEAVELIETVEQTGLTYAYGENYCYMPAPYEMRKLYRSNKIGEFEYGECEYVHNCEPIWPSITYGDKNHWRNNMYSTFYCTHSIGPIIHATSLRPVKVTGFESPMNGRRINNGAKSANFGMELITLENGGIIKSLHGDLYRNSIWYTMYGSKGRMESAREDADVGDVSQIYVNCDTFPGEYGNHAIECYRPQREQDHIGKNFGHGGSDFYSMFHFTEKLRGNKNADIIDVYEALDMFLPGLFAYRSILAGGIPMDIPNLRNPEERERWKNDTACTDPKVAGDMLLPTMLGGTPEIDDSIYEIVKQKYEADLRSETGHFKQIIRAYDQNNDQK